jgi:hypothetical protein
MNATTVPQIVKFDKAEVKVEPDEVFGTTIRINGHLGILDSVGLRLNDAIAIAKFVLSLEGETQSDDKTRMWGGAPEMADEDAYYDWLAQREEMRRDALADATSAHWAFD